MTHPVDSDYHLFLVTTGPPEPANDSLAQLGVPSISGHDSIALVVHPVENKFPMPRWHPLFALSHSSLSPSLSFSFSLFPPSSGLPLPRSSLPKDSGGGGYLWGVVFLILGVRIFGP